MAETLRHAKNALFDFLGLPIEEDESEELLKKEERHKRWDKRRNKIYWKKKKTDTGDDEVDASVGRRRKIPKKTKSSVLKMIWKATTVAAGVSHPKSRKLGQFGRSFAPTALDKGPQPDFETWKQELFYDEDQESLYPESQPDRAVREPKPVKPRAAEDFDEDEVDSFTGRGERAALGIAGIELRELPEKAEPGMSRITRTVVDAEPVLKRLEDKCCDCISCKCNCCKEEEDDDYSHRPYFTYFITSVQTIILICALAIYGLGPFGVDEVTTTEVVLKPSLAYEAEARSEFGNMWLGPSQKNLIHLGAKYSPCMRKDPNLERVKNLDRNEERTTGCCVRDDGSGCVQTTEHKCSRLISTFVKWNATSKIDNGYRSGAVCGLDPKELERLQDKQKTPPTENTTIFTFIGSFYMFSNFHCKKPSSTPPYEWDKTDFTNWPVCEQTKNVSSIFRGCSQPGSDCHMTCELLGRPCCFGIQGECMITTREHCEFRQGYYHDDKFLCSQVNCFEQICGMIPFVYEDRPDQFSRILSASLLHAGIFHLCITLVLQLWIMREVELLIGWIRMMIIYIGSGCVGTLASAILLPYHVEVGPSGAQFGVLGCMYVDLINQIINNKVNGKSEENSSLWFNFGVYSLVLFILFVLGLLPWMDNWSHIFGFIFGIFISLVVMKETTVEKKGITRVHVVVVFGILALLMFILLIIIFYAVPITESSWLQYLNCVPLTDTFCKNMDVSINRGSSYTTYL